MGSIRSEMKGRREECLLRSEKESHVLRESPAYSVCRSDFMAQLCKKILALAPQNYFAFVLVIIKVHSSSTIMYVVNESITTVS